MSSRTLILSLPLALLSLLTFTLAAEPVQLQPITVHDLVGRSPVPFNTKRKYDGDTPDLDLRNWENFFWGASGAESFIFANLTLYFRDDFEFILSMERFRGLLKEVDCDESMALTFNDNSTFIYATKAWNWVNDGEKHRFIVIADDKRCAPEDQRQPWVVSEVSFDFKNFKILMTAEQKAWEEIAHTYSLGVGHKPLEDHRLDVRDDPDLVIGLTSDFSRQLFSTTISGVDLAVDCSNCGTTGSLEVDFDIDVSWFKLQSASMTVQPKNVAAFLELGLSAQGTLSKSYGWQKNLVSIPIQGFSIAKILKVGAFLDVDVGFTMDEWTGSASASLGARLDLSNAAIVRVDLVKPSNNQFSGWAPALKPIPLTVDARVEGAAEIFAQVAVELSASALGKGFEVGLELKMPYIEADFAAMLSTAGVCGGDQTLGVDVDAHAGVDLSIQAATSGNEANPFWEQSLFQQSWPLFSKCFAFGPHDAVEGGGGGLPPPKKTKTKSKIRTPSPTVRPSRQHTKTLPPKTLTVLEPSSRRTSKTSGPTDAPPKSSSVSKTRGSERDDADRTKTQSNTQSNEETMSKEDKTSTKPPLTSPTKSEDSPSPSSSSVTTITKITSITSMISITESILSHTSSDHHTASSSFSSSFSRRSDNSQSGSSSLSSVSSVTISPPASPLSSSSTIRTFRSRSSTFDTSTVTRSASISSITSTTETVTTSSLDACPIKGCEKCREVDPNEAAGEPGADIPERRDIYGKRASKPRTYELSCGAAVETFTLVDYFSPSKIRKQADPSITDWFAAENTADCLKYGILHGTTAPAVDPKVRYNTEHVYEANWIRDFVSSLQSEVQCADIHSVFFLVPPTSDKWKDAAANWAQALMSSIGTEENSEYMVMLTSFINEAKYRVYSRQEMIADARIANISGDIEWKLGAVANIARVQEYMTLQTKVMIATAENIEQSLRDMVGNLPPASLALMGKYKDAEELAKAHRSWLQEVILKGNIKAITGLISWASLLTPSVTAPQQTSTLTFLKEMATAGLHIPTGMDPEKLKYA